MAQLEAVQKGELEDWELEGARSTLLNSYATVGDSQGKLENFYLGQAATGHPFCHGSCRILLVWQKFVTPTDVWVVFF